MGEDRKELTPIQQAILYKKKENPDWSNGQIAQAVDCSRSHVSDTLNRWDPDEMNEDGTVPIKREMRADETVSAEGNQAEDIEVNEGVVPGSDYFGFVAAAFVVQAAGFFLIIEPSAVPIISQNLASISVALAWMALPVVVFADANDLHRSDAARQPNRIVWPIAVLAIPVIGPLLYIRKRIVF